MVRTIPRTQTQPQAMSHGCVVIRQNSHEICLGIALAEQGNLLTATVLTDIATHLPKDFLSGAIYLGGLPCTGQTLYDVATSKAIYHVAELTSADTSVSTLRTRDEFFDV